jgi:tetratricopeptide (TPR) repeat protein
MSAFEKQVEIGRRAYSIFTLAFGCLVLLHVVLILLSFRDYGMTSDEAHHIRYGEQIVRWYTSGFEDKALFQTHNTWLYGGLFDTCAHLISQFLPLDRYDANHLVNACFGLIGVAAAFAIGTSVGGPFAGFLALALFLTPRYYGHSFNNPKDIPFAVCYLWGVFAILQCCRSFPSFSKRCIVGTGLAIGCALGIRVGGLMLIAYLGLVIAVLLTKHRGQLAPTLRIVLPRLGLIVLLAYVTMLLFWPYALTNPLSGPLSALHKFSAFSESHTSFFNGRYVLNTELPRLYAPTWFLLTVPEFTLVGVVIGMALLIIRKRFDHFIIFLAGAFPVLYAVIFNTPLYDGIRHLLFAMPPLVVFGMVAVSDMVKRPATHPVAGLIALLLCCLPSIQMIRLHPNQYVYFNTLVAGGLKKASLNYETDYWENTFKQGIRWAENSWQETRAGKQKIGGFSENIRYMLDSTRSEMAPNPEAADVYLGTTRYDRHRVVAGEILHIVASESTPLLYLIRPDTAYQHDRFFTDSPFYQFRLGEVLEGGNRFAEALTAFQSSLSQAQSLGYSEPFFLMRIYIRIGNQYESLSHYEQALATYLKALDYGPENAALHNNLGIVYARLGNHDEAISWLEKAIELDPKYFIAQVNLGGIAASNRNFSLARQAYQNALALNPDTVVRRSLGKIEYELENFDAAISVFQTILDRHPNDSQTFYDLALAYAKTGHYALARETILKAIQYAPEDPDSYFTLGSICMYQKDYPQAEKAYQKALSLKPESPDVHIGLALAYAGLGDLDRARQTLRQALVIDPLNAEAKQHLQTISR